MPDSQISQASQQLLDAVLPHVVFDGWSQAALDAGASELGWEPAQVAATCPRGAIDLAVAYHKRGDSGMVAAMAAADLSDMRYSEKVAHAIWLRLQGADREAVRRGSALFALPQHAAEGAALIWGTADAIWNTLGDRSDDVNWYSKRAILSTVYGAVVLFWLGDQGDGSDTRAFIDRRIADVMAFEGAKKRARESAALGPVMRGIGQMFSGVRAPHAADQSGLPGRWDLQEDDRT